MLAIKKSLLLILVMAFLEIQRQFEFHLRSNLIATVINWLSVSMSN